MKAVILAAGKGTRMKPLTDHVPKPMVVIRGKSFLEHLVEAFPPEVDEIIVVVGYRGEMIQELLARKYPKKKIRIVFQKKLSGTGSALMLVKKFMDRKGRFLLAYGDEYITRVQMKKCMLNKYSWLVRRMDDPSQSGVVSISKTGRIFNVTEKPKKFMGDMVSAGVMIVDYGIFDGRPVRHKTGEYYLTSMMQKFIKTHVVKAVPGTDNLAFSTAQDVANFNKK